MGLKISTKEEQLCSLSSSTFDGPLDNVIKMLKDKRAEFGKTHGNLRVELETEYGWYDDSWQNVVFYGCKKMTVKEFVKGNKQCITVK